MTQALEVQPASVAGRTGPKWTWAQYLALVGVPILLLEIWTMVAWLADHPHQITQYQEPHSVNWYACLILEIAAVLLFLVIGTRVVQGCIRERRVTFDAMFCIVGMTLVWADLAPNFFLPSYLYSSNFLNFNSPLGHMPFVVNPDAGAAPDPIPFCLIFESVGLLAAAMLVGAVARRVRARWPGLSNAQLLVALLGFGIILDVALEVPLVALGVWDFTSSPSWSLPLGGGGLRFALTEGITGSLWFVLCAAIRIFKDDRGNTVVERGVTHLGPLRRTVVSTLGLYALVQIVTWGPGLVPDFLYGPYQTAWPKLPAYIVSGVCDAPGFDNTRYGPCPGAPGFRMPGRTSNLPGARP